MRVSRGSPLSSKKPKVKFRMATPSLLRDSQELVMNVRPLNLGGWSDLVKIRFRHALPGPAASHPLERPSGAGSRGSRNLWFIRGRGRRKVHQGGAPAPEGRWRVREGLHTVEPGQQAAHL